MSENREPASVFQIPTPKHSKPPIDERVLESPVIVDSSHELTNKQTLFEKHLMAETERLGASAHSTNHRMSSRSIDAPQQSPPPRSKANSPIKTPSIHNFESERPPVPELTRSPIIQPIKMQEPLEEIKDQNNYQEASFQQSPVKPRARLQAPSIQQYENKGRNSSFEPRTSFNPHSSRGLDQNLHKSSRDTLRDSSADQLYQASFHYKLKPTRASAHFHHHHQRMFGRASIASHHAGGSSSLLGGHTSFEENRPLLSETMELPLQQSAYFPAVRDQLLLKCKDTIELLNEEIADERKLRRSLENELLDMQREINSLNEQVRDKNFKLARQSQEMLALEDINGSLRKKLDSTNEELKEMNDAESRLNALKKQVGKIEEELKEANQNRRLLEAELSQKEIQMNEVLLKRKSTESKLESLEEDYNTLKDDAGNWKSEAQSAFAKLEELQAQNRANRSLKEQLDSLQSEYQSSMAEGKSDLFKKEKELYEKYEGFERELSEGFQQREQQMRQELQAALSEFQKQNEKATAEISRLIGENEGLRIENNNLSNDMQQMVRSKNEELQELHQAIQNLENMRDSYQSQAAHQQSGEMELLQRQLYQAQVREQERDREFLQQRQAFSELLAETEALKQTNAEYKRTLTNKNKETEKLEHMVRYSREETDTIKDSLILRDSEINKLNNQLENYRAETSQYGRRAAEISDKITNIEELIDSYNALEKENGMLSNRMHSEARKKELVERTVEDLGKKLNELTSKYKREIEFFKKENKRKDEEIEGMQSRYEKKLANVQYKCKENSSFICESLQGELDNLKKMTREVEHDMNRLLKEKQSLVSGKQSIHSVALESLSGYYLNFLDYLKSSISKLEKRVGAFYKLEARGSRSRGQTGRMHELGMREENLSFL